MLLKLSRQDPEEPAFGKFTCLTHSMTSDYANQHFGKNKIRGCKTFLTPSHRLYILSF